MFINSEDAVVFHVTKFSDITEKIIPFFHKYSIVGVKALDFADFCLVAELMKNKAHLTLEGLDQIRQIKAGMNNERMRSGGSGNRIKVYPALAPAPVSRATLNWGVKKGLLDKFYKWFVGFSDAEANFGIFLVDKTKITGFSFRFTIGL